MKRDIIRYLINNRDDINNLSKEDLLSLIDETISYFLYKTDLYNQVKTSLENNREKLEKTIELKDKEILKLSYEKSELENYIYFNINRKLTLKERIKGKIFDYLNKK